MLASCDGVQTKPDSEVVDTSKPVTEQQASLTSEAREQIRLAENSDSPSQQLDYRIAAIRLYLQANEIIFAKQQLDIINAEKDRPLQDRVNMQIIAGEVALAEKNPTLASEIITEITPVTRNQQLKLYMLKADLDYLNGNYYYAVDRRVQLDKYIVDRATHDLNNKKIWAALSSMPSSQLNTEQTNKAVLKGWLELAKVMRKSQQNIGQLENNLLDWGMRYPSHPAGKDFLTELIDSYQSEVIKIKNIAVLLPMQGQTSTAAEAIKNGLLSAYYLDSTVEPKPVIKFYDTSDEALSFDELYQLALDSGATTVIGPLDKNIINAISQKQELDVPVLSLNYAESSLNITDNLYQFGLAPEDEARQVAELAIAQGKLRAAVFYPDSEWGKRLQDAFTTYYEYLGGKVMSSNDYATDSNDYRRPIRQLFNLDQSNIRIRKVQDTIGQNTQSSPYRRNDIDMIFLVATHRSARSIMPAFKFHHAGDVPVYATSHVYTGSINRELDRDLNGLIFCDLPWVIQNTSPLLKTFNANWPQQENYTRLFAFGIDAYHLIYNLDYLENNDYASYQGETGNMQLDEYNRIIRKLLWARFNNGQPVYFEPEVRTSEADSVTN